MSHLQKSFPAHGAQTRRSHPISHSASTHSCVVFHSLRDHVCPAPRELAGSCTALAPQLQLCQVRGTLHDSPWNDTSMDRCTGVKAWVPGGWVSRGGSEHSACSWCRKGGQCGELCGWRCHSVHILISPRRCTLPHHRENPQAALGPVLPVLTGLVALPRGAGPSLLIRLCFADEWGPARHSLHQAQPLGQEQPLCPPHRPVSCVSREAANQARLRSEHHPPKRNETPHLCPWDPLLAAVWTWVLWS